MGLELRLEQLDKEARQIPTSSSIKKVNHKMGIKAPLKPSLKAANSNKLIT
jgi:hypothetical protein